MVGATEADMEVMEHQEREAMILMIMTHMTFLHRLMTWPKIPPMKEAMKTTTQPTTNQEHQNFKEGCRRNNNVD